MSDAERNARDRRRARRTEFGPLRVRVHGRWEGVLINISAVGALIQLPIPQPVDTDLTVDVEFDQDAVLQLAGRVVRSSPTPLGGRPSAPVEPTDYYVALEFHEAPDAPELLPEEAE